MMITDLVKSIYRKQPMKLEDAADLGLCLGLTNIFKLNPLNSNILKKLSYYIFFVEPRHYLILLFLLIPYQQYVPFYNAIKKQENKKDKLYEKIKYVLGWSDKELQLHTSLLNKVIDREYWCNELAVKEEK